MRKKLSFISTLAAGAISLSGCVSMRVATDSELPDLANFKNNPVVGGFSDNIPLGDPDTMQYEIANYRQAIAATSVVTEGRDSYLRDGLGILFTPYRKIAKGTCAVTCSEQDTLLNGFTADQGNEPYSLLLQKSTGGGHFSHPYNYNGKFGSVGTEYHENLLPIANSIEELVAALNSQCRHSSAAEFTKYKLVLTKKEHMYGDKTRLLGLNFFAHMKPVTSHMTLSEVNRRSKAFIAQMEAKGFTQKSLPYSYLEYQEYLRRRIEENM